MPNKKLKLGVFATHPIQYQVPLWRLIAMEPDISLRVFYCCTQGFGNHVDSEFGTEFAWDVPLLEGYESEFLREGPLSTPGILRIANCAALLRQHRFDCVLTNGYTAPHTRQLRNLKGRYRYRFAIRGEFTDRRPKQNAVRTAFAELYRRWFYRKVDAFCYIGSHALSHLDRYGIPPQKRFFSPYNVDDQLLTHQMQQSSRAKARKELGIPSEAVVFLFSGKMIERKQPLLLASAIADLATDHRVHLIAIGEGPLKETLREQLLPVLGSRLTLPGFVNQSELYKYFLPSDVFVLPSSFDAWGLVVNEAMHFGLPVVASDGVGCAIDLIQEGRTGYAFPWQSTLELKARLQRFLEDPHHSQRLGKNAQILVQDYSSQAAAKGIIAAVSRQSTKS